LITENLSTLKINKLSQEQYDKALAEGKINPNEIYLTPDEPPIRYVEFNKDVEITVEDSTVYIAKEPIQYLTINYPSSNFICDFIFTIADKDEDGKELPFKIQLIGDTKYIGKAPDFKNGETWELNIHNGIIASGKVVSE
jgi:hypothetical protein